jgi:hypothetical protein
VFLHPACHFRCQCRDPRYRFKGLVVIKCFPKKAQGVISVIDSGLADSRCVRALLSPLTPSTDTRVVSVLAALRVKVLRSTRSSSSWPLALAYSPSRACQWRSPRSGPGCAGHARSAAHASNCRELGGGGRGCWNLDSEPAGSIGPPAATEATVATGFFKSPGMCRLGAPRPQAQADRASWASAAGGAWEGDAQGRRAVGRWRFKKNWNQRRSAHGAGRGAHSDRNWHAQAQAGTGRRRPWPCMPPRPAGERAACWQGTTLPCSTLPLRPVASLGASGRCQ